MRKAGMNISYSFGVADLLHIGHIRAFEAAKTNADLYIFGLIDDASVMAWFGQILSTFSERKETLSGIKSIDEVIEQKGFDPIQNLKALRLKYPNDTIMLYASKNWEHLISSTVLKNLNIEVSFLPYYEKLSLENILQNLNSQTKAVNTRNTLVSTKANTLLGLKGLLTKSKIERILVVTPRELKDSPLALYEKVKKTFGAGKIVVRSSCSQEDGYDKSNAGFYESILNVDVSDKNAVLNAVKTVGDSYLKANPDFDNSDEQILIQTQTENIAVCGVLFTRDINKNRPYYLINYEDDGLSDSVTAGRGGVSLRISHKADISKLPERWQNLLAAVKELQSVLAGMILDIEFAVLKDGSVVIFQVRPLAAAYKFKKNVDDDEFFAELDREKERYCDFKDAYSGVTMMLSDMAFWNPAEIIGSNPKELAYSLYKDIITARAWNEGLVPLGYKSVPHNLMYQIGNKPYISLEYSFRSLIPASLSEELTKKLVAYYRQKLEKNLTAHDKIEFEIVFSCFDFKTDEALEELKDNGFSDGEIKSFRNALFDLTKDSVSRFFDILSEDKKDLLSAEMMRAEIEKECRKDDITVKQLISYIQILLNELKLNATPHFSRQARFAFIAKSFLRTLVEKGFFTQDDVEKFMLTVETVASDFQRDINAFLNKRMTADEFNLKYGHLRSGTYDITTERYDKMDFANSTAVKENAEEKKSGRQLNNKRLQSVLDEYGFGLSAEDFQLFMKTAFEMREWFKFEFTKILSLAIECLAKLGEKLGFTREDVAYLDVRDISALSFYENDWERKDFIRTLRDSRKTAFEKASLFVLPDVVLNADSLDVIRIASMRPNFITEKETNGEIVFLEDEKTMDIDGKIVCVTRADPGFDWIFSKKIKGLITKYGGVASHMAIRCAEFGLPAAIGCGERIYSSLAGAKTCVLDCKNGVVKKEA